VWLSNFCLFLSAKRKKVALSLQNTSGEFQTTANACRTMMAIFSGKAHHITEICTPVT
jgi:hypothetical protein